MEQIKDSISKKLPPLKLYIDDLEEICSVVSRHCKNISIEACGYKLDNCAELEKLNEKKIEDFHIEGRGDKNILIWLYRNSASFNIYSGDTESKGIVAELEEAFLKAKLRVWFVPGWLFVVSFGMLIVTARIAEPTVQTISLLLLSLGVFILTGFDYYFKMERFCRIIPVYRSTRKNNFWSRNKDQLILNLISSAAGVFLGCIGTLIFQRLFEK